MSSSGGGGLRSVVVVGAGLRRAPAKYSGLTEIAFLIPSDSLSKATGSNSSSEK